MIIFFNLFSKLIQKILVSDLLSSSGSNGVNLLFATIGGATKSTFGNILGGIVDLISNLLGEIAGILTGILGGLGSGYISAFLGGYSGGVGSELVESILQVSNFDQKNMWRLKKHKK